MMKRKAIFWLVFLLVTYHDASREGRAQPGPRAVTPQRPNTTKPSSPRAAASKKPNTPLSARDEVKQGLAHLATFRERNDIEHAMEWAEHTWKVAEKRLTVKDPLRVQAEVAFYHLRGFRSLLQGHPEGAKDLALAERASES